MDKCRCPEPSAADAQSAAGPCGAADCRRRRGRRFELVEIVGDDDCRPCDGPPPEPVPPLRDECGSPCPNPQRPQRPQGKDTGRQSDPTPLTPGDLHHPHPPGVWGGQRQDLHLPFLFIRAFPGDLGARPLNVPFWESPDIFIVPGVDPTAAPAIPAAFGDIALANQPNTLYAHVWNFGQAASAEAVVEFYWCDPSLGITSASTHLIAQTAVSLGAKGSGHAHAVVKCPAPWTPTFLNGGHECLLVRVWDNPSDLPGLPRMDARVNRHVGQRNVHVVAAGAKAMARTVSAARDLFPPAAKALTQPILLRVGPLFNEPARVFVERVAPNNMPWLQLRSGERGRFPAGAPPSGVALLSRPVASGGGFSAMGLAASHCVSDDDQMVAFMTSDTTPARGEAHVYRVSATQGGVLFGGYTVVVLG